MRHIHQSARLPHASFNFMPRKLRTACAMGALALMAATGVSAAPVLVNGSLTGPLAMNSMPSGWSQYLTPDTMDETHNLGTDWLPFTATPSASPDGGTWAGLVTALVPADYIESFSQTVGGFTIGASYTLRWYHANFGYEYGFSYSSANAIEVLADGVSVGAGSVRAVGSGWVEESISFVAADADIDLTFRPLDTTVFSYQSIDGIRLTQVQAIVVPEPGSLPLFAGAGAALVLGTRRRKQVN